LKAPLGLSLLRNRRLFGTAFALAGVFCRDPTRQKAFRAILGDFVQKRSTFAAAHDILRMQSHAPQNAIPNISIEQKTVR